METDLTSHNNIFAHYVRFKFHNRQYSEDSCTQRNPIRLQRTSLKAPAKPFKKK